MPAALLIDRSAGVLRDDAGRRFAPERLAWIDEPGGGDPASPLEALRWLQAKGRPRIRIPVGVIGPREATPHQRAAAAAVGGMVARLGLVVLCGGKVGVMEAVCQGCEAAGGLSIGLLPDPDPAAANAHAGLVIATGIGVARNALIARAALCLIAIGGGYGTLSEIAFGMQFGKPVFGLENAPAVDGMIRPDSLDALQGSIVAAALGLDPLPLKR